MTDTTSISDLALGALMSYGPLALALALMVAGIGLPIPGTILVVAAGAFAQQEFIQWPLTLVAGLAGVVIGDSISYGIGRVGGSWAERRYGQSSAWITATDQFARRGGWAIFLTRFLLTPLALAVNLIAGFGGYPFARFLAMDVLGELVWVIGYGAIGYALGTQWQTASQLLSDFSGLILGIAALVAGVWIGVRMLLKRRTLAAGAKPATALEDA